MRFQKLSFNFLFKLALSLLAGVTHFAFSILVMRRLSPAEYGLFALALSWASIFNILGDFGMNPLITRDLAQKPHRGRYYLLAIARLKTGLLLLAGTALALFILAQPERRDSIGLFLAAFCMVAATATVETIQAFFFAYDRFTIGTSFAFLQKTSAAVAGISVLLLGGGLSMALWTSAGAGWSFFVAAAVALTLFIRRSPAAVDETGNSLREILQSAFPIFAATMVGTLYFRIDTVFLSHMRGDYETGLYGTAYRFFEITTMLPGVFVAVTQPALARAAAAGEMPQMFRRFLRWMLLLALFATVCLLSIAPFITRLTGNVEYREASQLLSVLSFTTFPLFLNYFFMSALTVMHKQAQAAWMAGVGLTFNIIANIIVIPIWGAYGAAGTTFLSEIVMVTACWLAYRSACRASGQKTI